MATTGPTQLELDALANIDLSDIPAIIKWNDEQPRGIGTALSSTPVSLDAFFDSSSTIALFRLRIALLQRGSDKSLPLFLLIGPPHIQSVVTCVPDPMPEGAAKSDCDTICLRFQLNNPPTLIVPPEPLHLKDKSQLTTMRSVRWAAQQTVLVVHIQEHTLSAHQLRVLSESSLDHFTSSLRHTDIGRLYGGRGGKIVDAGADHVAAENAPPSYKEVPPPPPMAPISYGMLSRFSCMFLSLLEIDHP